MPNYYGEGEVVGELSGDGDSSGDSSGDGLASPLGSVPCCSQAPKKPVNKPSTKAKLSSFFDITPLSPNAVIVMFIRSLIKIPYCWLL